MAQTKPTKPTDLMPRHFADDGIKNNFSSAKIASGFSSNFDDILQGDNLNYMIDSIGKELQYLSTVVDFIVDMPINKTIKVNANNNLEYVNLVEDASDKANISLSNLDATGQALVNNKANVSLSNLDATGQALINNKANIDLSNMNPNQKAKNTIMNWEKPNYSSGITISANTSYTALVNGWVKVDLQNTGGRFYINSIEMLHCNRNDAFSDSNSAFFPISTGDVVFCNTSSIIFYPNKGA